MLSDKGFDLWADDYDQSVEISDNDGSYPFAGYKNILNEIYNRILNESYRNILDIGFGTGTLISKLYDHGYKIYGQDFSKRMIEIAQNKMPNAKLFYGDISKGLVNPLLEHKYNAIIATYSLHHLTDEKKVIFLKKLLEQLYDGGCVYIGDIAFLSRSLHDKCMKEAYEQWDNDEIYFVVDEFRSYFLKLKFEKFSECSGLITLKK
ncbi:class I SAM-dependent methyltransferase [Anaerococcus vaginalis]|uniref:class I SAM-dependent DNA methyltransferase n=1 Tax=Anaerococcus vaginalis TaxID=33037 RepID=UPI0028FE59D9|nr:class I SAM-dependent methyltransferase [Anaerococcus vaginalis]MDU2375648.1 class I SAM-dependent methyltransferase [Anaerococcus vaginalis]